MSTHNLVVKHNYLIEKLINNWYSQPAICQKLVAVIISMIYNRKEDLAPFYRIAFKDLYYFLGLQRCNDANKMIRTACKRLNSQPIIEDRKLLIYWFSSLEFLPDGTVEFEFSKKLARYLVDMKGEFTRYRLYNVLPMKRSYSIRMFEIMKQYERRQERTIDLEEFRHLLGVTPGKYLKANDLTKRVIDPCRRELLKKTDIGFNYFPVTGEKGSKRITAFRFTIFHNPKKNRAEAVRIYQDSLKDRTDLNYNPEAYEIPQGSKNTRTFNSVYKTFMDNRSKFPAEWGFKEYVEQYQSSWKIVHLSNGGRDLVASELALSRNK